MTASARQRRRFLERARGRTTERLLEGLRKHTIVMVQTHGWAWTVSLDRSFVGQATTLRKAVLKAVKLWAKA